MRQIGKRRKCKTKCTLTKAPGLRRVLVPIGVIAPLRVRKRDFIGCAKPLITRKVYWWVMTEDRGRTRRLSVS